MPGPPTIPNTQTERSRKWNENRDNAFPFFRAGHYIHTKNCWFDPAENQQQQAIVPKMRKTAFPALQGLDVRTLRLFEAVIKTGNLTQAARANHLAVGAASRRISNFEALIGSPLLERFARGVRPTATGIKVAESVRNILDEVNGLSSISQNLRQGLTRHVRLLGNGVAITEYLPGVIRKFRDRHPDVLVEIEESRSWDTAKALQNERARIGIAAVNQPFGMGLNQFEFVTEPLVLVAHKSHPLGRRRRVRFADTLDYEYIGLQQESIIYGPLREEARNAGKVIRSLAEVGGLYHACRMVSAGLGLAVVPESLAASLKNCFDMSVIQLETQHNVFREIVLHVDEDRMTETERALLEHLRDTPPLPASSAA